MAVLRSGNSRLAAGGRGSVVGALVSIGVVVLVAGCSSAITPAPIVDRSTGGASAPASIPTTTPVAGAAAVAPPVQPEAGPGFYRVKPGDTLYGIARAQKQKPADLIKWNNLPESKQVNIDQLLRVAPPGSTPASTDDWSKSTAAGNSTKSGRRSLAEHRRRRRPRRPRRPAAPQRPRPKQPIPARLPSTPRAHGSRGRQKAA